jgi:2-iminobutanoate/2-iminopropanoate deaminase
MTGSVRRIVSAAGVHQPTTYYSHAAVADGTVYTAGQAPHATDGSVVDPGDPRAQVRQVWDNMQKVLAAAGLTTNDIVRLCVFLRSRELIPVFWEIAGEYLGMTHPAATVAVVPGLADNRYLLEMEAVAVGRENPLGTATGGPETP